MAQASLGRTIVPRVKGLLETVTFYRDPEESLSFQGGKSQVGWWVVQVPTERGL